MELLRHIVLFVHLIGFATLFGAWAVEAVTRRFQVTKLMNWALVLTLVAGLALSAPWGLSYELNYVKIGVKLVVLIVIGGLLGVGSARQRRTGAVPPVVFWLIGILTAANAAIAVIWR